MKFFTPNIQAPGRIARAVCGATALAGACVWRGEAALTIGLACSGIFMLFEAIRGWCVARACGVKTPM